MNTQTTLANAKVLRYFKPWTIEQFTTPNGKTQLAISDGIVTNYVTCYGNGQWRTDDSHAMQNTRIRRWLDTNCDNFI